jgi:hypothetical protein
MEHDTLSPSLTTFREKLMSTILKVKGRLFDKFKAYKALVDNEISMKIKTL